MTNFRKYPPALERAIAGGVARTGIELDKGMPLTAKQMQQWLVYLAGGKPAERYYLQRADLPMFLFPWFLEKTQGKPELAFLCDRVYSTINGFYYIRLLDDVTDHHATNEMALLPALGFFHTQFQTPYQTYFAAGHPFWNYFQRVWLHSADVTMRDLNFNKVSHRQFVRIAAQKTCAVKIPLAAVAYKYDCADALPGWSQFMDIYGCWHQMTNDLFHWHEDLSLGTVTYFLSKAATCKRARETTADWVIRTGFQWARELLDEWMAQARDIARGLNSTDLLNYLEYRSAKLAKDAQETLKMLHTAAQLGDLLLS